MMTYLFNCLFNIMDKKNYLLAPVVILAVGIAFICLFNQADIIRWILVLVGVAILVPAVFNIIWILVRRNRKDGSREVNDDSSLTVSVISGVLGLWIVCMPDFFEKFMVFLFAAILAYLAISDVVLMVRAARPARLPFWFYIVPFLMLAAAVVLVFTPVRTINSTVVLITGIAMTASGLNRLIEVATAGSMVKNS